MYTPIVATLIGYVLSVTLPRRRAANLSHKIGGTRAQQFPRCACSPRPFFPQLTTRESARKTSRENAKGVSGVSVTQAHSKTAARHCEGEDEKNETTRPQSSHAGAIFEDEFMSRKG